MTHMSSEELFRQALEAEGGVPVSAGARVAHVRAAVALGRAFYVDLSEVPEDKRPTLVADIKELVKRASSPDLQQDVNRAPDVSKASH